MSENDVLVTSWSSVPFRNTLYPFTPETVSFPLAGSTEGDQERLTTPQVTLLVPRLVGAEGGVLSGPPAISEKEQKTMQTVAENKREHLNNFIESELALIPKWLAPTGSPAEVSIPGINTRSRNAQNSLF